MRAVLGFAVAHLVLCAPGLLALLAARMVALRARDALLALGPAYFLGVALTMPVLQLLLVVGIPISLASTLLVVVALSAGLWWLARRRGVVPPLPPPAAFRSAAERAIVLVGGAMTALWFVLGSRSFDQLPTQVDDARIWSLRALGLFFYGRLQPEIFTGSAYSTSHLDYPLLEPLLSSTIFRFMGGEDLRLVHLELWIMMAAFAWTVAWALLPGRRALAWLPAVVVLPILSPVVDNVALGNVDTLVAGFVATGALFVALWIEDGRAEHMVLGAVLLGGAAATKNEGLIGALIVVVLAGLLVTMRRVPLRPWLAGLGVVAFAILPWQIWMSAHDIGNRDVPGLGTALKPSYLSDQWDRVDPTLHRLFSIFANQGVYLWIAPVFLALVVAAIWAGRERMRAVAAFYLAAVLLFFASLVFVFWAGRLDITFHLDTAASRTSMTYMMVGLVGLAHLASSAVRAREGRTVVAAEPGAGAATPAAALGPGRAGAERSDPAPTP